MPRRWQLVAVGEVRFPIERDGQVVREPRIEPGRRRETPTDPVVPLVHSGGSTSGMSVRRGSPKAPPAASASKCAVRIPTQLTEQFARVLAKVRPADCDVPGHSAPNGLPTIRTAPSVGWS